MEEETKKETKKVVKKYSETEEKEYKESVKTFFNVNNDDEYAMKSYFVERCIFSWGLNFYEMGDILFFPPKDKVLKDKILISLFSEGNVKEQSEKLGIKMDKHFKLEEYTLLSKKDISYFEISQNSCPNPDCESCKNGEVPTVNLMIFTNSKPIQILFDKQSDAIAVMIMLTNWRDNKNFDQFMNDPFDIED